MAVQENLVVVKEAIKKACERAERSVQEIKLVAVTKTVGIEATNEVVEAGLTDLGENRNEGFLQKYEHFGSKVNWHFIGSLQTRKAKEVINEIDYLHSLDRLSLAKEIQKRATKKVRCFVQVKTSREESKQGLSTEEAIAFIQALQDFDKIEVVGLMTMAPFTEEEAEIRRCFRTLRMLQKQVQELELPYAPCEELSMGMSNDYTIAIEEGATYIRLGTILVGKV
ncbi:YggS family pyridoxal phosphate-dependent enzyme [Bacillus pseudomycoides]|uniref:Pyridoxal phosphate homeostasis protein n=1 Tax=Bacillus pseudomycoides TaxID=64104 RepID=A0AA91VH79_9BACI|nr:MULTISPECIES: YggS family pyridoxal phosphate-dependent enzyme [Bacillus]PEB55026.1 YggS family pyridoxal phosphate-dependent enzyme [Bacillus sp. AFS098217]PED84260.1 YggS family pyridoxal phosphate-dependent enzyme [Bacillus pseudomycoides]PEU15786.1 YggS family pyridoxal phosphate-dependent enzyme [Bacillus sp. AFS019443]PEU21290.1 YggS family pyridoxal phosphate-dependent enzyme [Bacillus sp. AFS014408]PFW64913.1 YggS family pyridoxal phosphate-dependent enzyme [Bacillus sp. AFS075034]